MLDLSKIEAGRFDVEMQDVNLRDVVQECLDSVSPRADANGIMLENNIPESDPVLVKTDPQVLRQALLNLVSNAVKFNQPGGRVTIGYEDIGNDFLRVNINDTGIGIPPDRQESVFTPFDRLGRESGNIEGAGVGLSITQRIVEALDGKIGFQSNEDAGTTFWIELPNGA